MGTICWLSVSEMVGANVYPLTQKESVKLWFLLRVSRLMELGPADTDGRDGLCCESNAERWCSLIGVTH